MWATFLHILNTKLNRTVTGFKRQHNMAGFSWWKAWSPAINQSSPAINQSINQSINQCDFFRVA